MSIPNIELHPSQGGLQMPQLGLGTWKAAPGVVSNVVSNAIKTGYRAIDCACDYGNEAEVGQGIADGLAATNASRSDLFVTSKLWNTFHRPEHVLAACERTLSDLNLSYLDLYLIHFPISLKYVPFDKRYPPEWLHDPDTPDLARPIVDPVSIRDTWAAMEGLVEKGLVRHIGISNFPAVLIMELLTTARIRPSVLQVELHPYLQQQALLSYCERERIAVTAYSSLGSMSYAELDMDQGDNLLDEAVLKEIGKTHGKTAAQVALRWAVQRGTIIIPKTSKVERLQENMSVFSWSLTEEDMRKIASMERGTRYNDPKIYGAAMGLPMPIYD